LYLPGEKPIHDGFPLPEEGPPTAAGAAADSGSAEVPTGVQRCIDPPQPFVAAPRMPSSDTDPHWSTIDIAGHPCECFDPPGAAPGIAVIYLHGVRERTLRQSSGLREAIETAGLRALAPRTGRSWWLDRIIPGFDAGITPERYVVTEVVGEVERRFGVKPPLIGLAGTSMGGQGALRLAYRHPTVFPVAAAIAPAIDFHTALRDLHTIPDGDLFANLYEIYGDVERARQDTAILHVHPLNWPRHQWFASDPEDWQWHDGADRLHGKLAALGIPHTAILDVRGGGHGPEYYNRIAPDAVRFILTALESEARRLA
jgi:S-formylglutathione hydrolase FrmB